MSIILMLLCHARAGEFDMDMKELRGFPVVNMISGLGCLWVGMARHLSDICLLPSIFY
ncbi:protein of unknown function [Serratia sp. Tan611]|nr:protein of unknown function [Serratia sp. Tan611]